MTIAITKEEMKVDLPFRYPGGKYYALKQLRPFWESVEHDEYREPFVGGGAVFFNKPKVCYNWLNDMDEELIAAYKVMSEPKMREKLVAIVSKEKASKERWKEVRAFQPEDSFEKAYQYYYLNRTSFSGKLSSPAWGYRPKRSLPPERWHERIIPCGEKLESIRITCQDFEFVIKAPPRGNNVLLYIDPPYFSPPKKKHYRNGFNIEDHLRLCESLKKTKYKFFLTYDDTPDVRDLYSWANIYTANFFYRVDNSTVQKGKRKMGCETIITNYKIPKQLEFINILDKQ